MQDLLVAAISRISVCVEGTNDANLHFSPWAMNATLVTHREPYIPVKLHVDDLVSVDYKMYHATGIYRSF